MKLLRYGTAGREKPGLLDSNNQISRSVRHRPRYREETRFSRTLSDRLRMLDPATLPVVKGAQRIGPCVGQVGKFICVGLNYSDHAAESGMAVPAEPILFMKATSSIVGPDDDILLPRGSQKTDWEVELGVVIGKPGKFTSPKQIPRARCRLLRRPRHLGARLSARRDGAVGQGQERRHVWSDRALARDDRRSAGSREPETLARPGRHRRQDGSTKTLIFGVQYLVSYISRFMSLQSGDVIYRPARHQASATGRSRSRVSACRQRSPPRSGEVWASSASVVRS